MAGEAAFQKEGTCAGRKGEVLLWLVGTWLSGLPVNLERVS